MTVAILGTGVWLGTALRHDHRDHWLMVSRFPHHGFPRRHRSSPNAPVHPPGPLQWRGLARNKSAAPVVVQRLVRPPTPVALPRMPPSLRHFATTSLALAV